MKIILHPPQIRQQQQQQIPHSWMLYTSQVPVLDLTGEHIKTKEDIEATFHTLNLCPQEEAEEKSNGRKERRVSKSK